MIIVFSTIILSIISGITYRMGGSGNYPRYLRELGLCICMSIEMMVLGYLHWSLIICFGMLYAVSSTYFKKKGTDATWINWFLVGLGFSISIFPIILVYHNWIGFSFRSLICTGFIVMWSEINGNAVWEEVGRGIIPIATLPLLLIGV